MRFCGEDMAREDAKREAKLQRVRRRADQRASKTASAPFRFGKRKTKPFSIARFGITRLLSRSSRESSPANKRSTNEGILKIAGQCRVRASSQEKPELRTGSG